MNWELALYGNDAIDCFGKYWARAVDYLNMYIYIEYDSV